MKMKGAVLFSGEQVVPDREQCVASLVTVLQGVETIKKVSRQFKTFDEISDKEFPHVVVEEDESGENEIDYSSSGFGNITFTVNIIGYVNTSKNLATAINDLDKLVKKTLGTDFMDATGVMQTAGLVGFTIRELSEKSGTEANPFGSFVRPIELEYQGQVSEGL